MWLMTRLTAKIDISFFHIFIFHILVYSIHTEIMFIDFIFGYSTVTRSLNDAHIFCRILQ